ncbi:MAG TPA: replicative DNA helicase [Planctomycetota bacterium]|nr:replicative DNA helicase [Planctomycetota bacterium]
MAAKSDSGGSAEDALFGRVPPQNLEAEQAVLGCMLLEPDTVGLVVQEINREDFYSPEHQAIFDGVTTLFDRGDPIDTITLREQLNKDGMLDRVGGSEYLATLTETVPSAASAVHYARIVRDRAILRMLIGTTTTILRDAYDEAHEPRELLDRAERMMFEVAGKHAATTVHSVRDVLKQTFEIIDDLHARKGRLRGLSTGFYDLDDLTTGLHGSELIIVAARPSIGKTTFALNIARHVAIEEEAGVLIFNFEMSKEQLAQNLLCSEARVDAQQIRKGLLNDQQFSMLTTAAGRLGEAPIFIDDSSGIGILELKAKARRMKAHHDIKLVIVDYLQLMDAPSRESREREVAELSRGLKALSRELDIPIMALSQLNRGPEQREDHHPLNSDLRESGSLEQDADVIIFLHREEVYQPHDPKHRNRAEIIVSKQRNGPTGTLELQFQKNVLRFQNLAAQRAAVAET